ncbi:hypothetical protein PIB30_019241 [Stylosanthes scabra]|uniref:Uncharacterized protein n=1 Tax=Stylosanthes scabra TaxID=79078 RepID=A0ABU6R8N9_9FABA|nr:hypothetical protein [Stylosanthes scabra]
MGFTSSGFTGNSQTFKPHKASAPSLFFLLFVEMLPPSPNLLTVSDKGHVSKFSSRTSLCGLWNMNSAISLTTLLESTHSVAPMRIENYMPSSGASYLYDTNLSDGKSEIEGWDLCSICLLYTLPHWWNYEKTIEILSGAVIFCRKMLMMNEHLDPEIQRI